MISEGFALAPSIVRRPRARTLALAGVLALLTTGAPSFVGAQQAASAAADLQLQPGDAVKLSVWRAPELSGEFPVAADGSLAHPAFPSLLVAGVPLRRVQTMLDSAVRVENVGARVVMQPMLRVIVGGEVGVPNLYHFPAGTSVAEAIVLAGGHTDRADLRKLTLVRNGTAMVYDITDPAGPATHTAVVSGDQLVLQRRRASFRETILPVAQMLGSAASIAVLIIRLHRG